MWADKLKELNVNIHIIATGAGSKFQDNLWIIPGASSYLSGASFPYSVEETEEILGFKPEKFCSEETAVDLASAAYMKAYKINGKNPVGIGLTASVTSDRPHKGDHRVHVCIITNDQIKSYNKILTKESVLKQRELDGLYCDELLFQLMIDVLNINDDCSRMEYKEATELAKDRFFKHPFFTIAGKRRSVLDNSLQYSLMSGAFNPPHKGHFGMADEYESFYPGRVVFEISTNPPHKETLSVQEMLKRAKLLQGRDRYFSTDIPLFLDKARKFPGMPLIMGADAMVRMLDPKWGTDIVKMINEFYQLETKIYVVGRNVNEKFTNKNDIINLLNKSLSDNLVSFNCINEFQSMVIDLPGKWDISSTELRNGKK